MAYSPLLSGAYVPTDRPLGPEFDHAGTSARLSGITEPLIVCYEAVMRRAWTWWARRHGGRMA